ncbi:adenine nucleotide alpha hydrolases-like protein [Gonapodya prolifera JEL478]|uniref:Adenine nucleotide alpha hydrolases-like protein n=1 Tax=Gonapodya prolifera (strain JEL478) TaxID=1344416 RepID=A0A139AZ18_GONPJ|nr:adenine nucleotide alpha hydrolases-like protein [Gonapodya prolifera JEL478]|eukprot:KXS21998.1 adenine nucleotide alpha hydrolases-like protein [Gonapodya prolifera JEL478]
MSVVIIATDFTEASQHALDWSAQRLLKTGDKVILLHTVLPSPPTFDVDTTGVYVDDEDLRQKQLSSVEAESEIFLKKVKESVFHDDKGISVEVVTEVGDPGTVICSKVRTDRDFMLTITLTLPWHIKAKELKAALVVVGTHSKSNWQTLLLGSVSNYVLHHCESPVVMVKI